MVVGVGPVGDMGLLVGGFPCQMVSWLVGFLARLWVNMGLFSGGFRRLERDNSEKKREGEDQR